MAALLSTVIGSIKDTYPSFPLRFVSLVDELTKRVSLTPAVSCCHLNDDQVLPVCTGW